jgi:hypothetical protein
LHLIHTCKNKIKSKNSAPAQKVPSIFIKTITVISSSASNTQVLRRIFGPKRDELTGEWRELHNEELRELYSLPSIMMMMKSWRMRLTGHVA